MVFYVAQWYKFLEETIIRCVLISSSLEMKKKLTIHEVNKDQKKVTYYQRGQIGILITIYIKN